MNWRDFRKAGHTPTLFSAFLYFDISFMIWVLLGALANAILREVPMTDSEKGLLVAVPILAGAALRLVLGVMADRVGARRTALLGMCLTLVPLLMGWLWADSYEKLLLVGVFLGVAGASFAVALPLASRWYPPEHQGLAMGIAGAGNSGTALATFFAPRLAEAHGWQAVFALALIPLGLTMVLFFFMAKDSPNQPPPRPVVEYARILRHRDTWWFCLFYAVTFGGFVGLASFLNIFFRDEYRLSPVEAGNFATLCVIAGSFLRPIGGYLADRLGGVRLLILLYAGVAIVMLGMATLPILPLACVLLVLGMGILGMGNGAVFQVVPQRFPKEIGALTGVVGAAGGVGGFFLPTLLGTMKQQTGSFSLGFVGFAAIGLFCSVALLVVARSWGTGVVEAQPEPVLATTEG